jgi:hypothetical protein
MARSPHPAAVGSLTTIFAAAPRPAVSVAVAVGAVVTSEARAAAEEGGVAVGMAPEAERGAVAGMVAEAEVGAAAVAVVAMAGDDSS